jgi:hypothetical protein
MRTPENTIVVYQDVSLSERFRSLILYIWYVESTA